MKHLHYNIILYEYLNGRYKDIVKDMLCDEFYIVQDKLYDVVYDICYYDTVVGFLACNIIDDSLVVELCYIRPDFRGLGLFNRALNTVNTLFDIHVMIYLPNTYTVDSLIRYKWAIKITDTIILSRFPLTWQDKNTNEYYHSRIYDKTINGIVDLHHKKISPLLYSDIQRFHTDRDITDEYFTDIKNEIINNI